MSMPCSLYIKVDIFLFPRTFSKKNCIHIHRGSFLLHRAGGEWEEWGGGGGKRGWRGEQECPSWGIVFSYRTTTKSERVRERREEGGKSDCWEVEAFSKGGVTQASTGEQKLFHVWIETAQLIYYSRILLKNRLETLTY